MKAINNAKDLEKAIAILEAIGDAKDFGKNQASIDEYDALATIIEEYEKEHYPIKSGSPEEIANLIAKYNKDKLRP